MGILDRYFFSFFVKSYAGALLLLSGVAFISKIMEYMPIIAKYEGPKDMVYWFYLANYPFFLTIVNAPAMVFAVSFTIAFFSRSKELIVIMTSGRSFLRILTPVVLFSVFNAFFFFWFNEYVAYPQLKESFTLGEILKGNADGNRLRGLQEIQFRAHNRFYYMASYDQKAKTFRHFHLTEFNPDGSIRRIMEAPSGSLKGKEWTLKSGRIQYFSDAGEYQESRFFSTETVTLPEDETWFGGNEEYLRFEEMNIHQVQEKIDFMKRSGIPYIKYEVEYFWHWGFPAISVIVTLLGGIIGSRMRNAQIASSIGLSITLTVIYFFVMFIGKSFGNSGLVHPAIAGNIANIIFAFVIVYMMVKYHQ